MTKNYDTRLMDVIISHVFAISHAVICVVITGNSQVAGCRLIVRNVNCRLTTKEKYICR